LTIKHAAVAGTLESCDVMITVEPSDTLEITVDSTVKDLFGKKILACVEENLKKQGVTAAKVQVQDKGAFDCTIAARLEAAVLRAQKEG